MTVDKKSLVQKAIKMGMKQNHELLKKLGDEEMTVDEIIHEIRKQAFYLKARNPSINPNKLRVYLGGEEIYTLKSDVHLLYENMESQDELRVLGMPVFEVVTNKPHIKVTTD